MLSSRRKDSIRSPQTDISIDRPKRLSNRHFARAPIAGLTTPNYGLLRTKDRCPISEFASVRGAARLVIEENPIAAPRLSFAETSARSFAAEAPIVRWTRPRRSNSSFRGHARVEVHRLVVARERHEVASDLEQANGGSAASVIAHARNQGWTRDVELVVFDASRERAGRVHSASEVAT
jgi:hypothetical protein